MKDVVGRKVSGDRRLFLQMGSGWVVNILVIFSVFQSSAIERCDWSSFSYYLSKRWLSSSILLCVCGCESERNREGTQRNEEIILNGKQVLMQNFEYTFISYTAANSNNNSYSSVFKPVAHFSSMACYGTFLWQVSLWTESWNWRRWQAARICSMPWSDLRSRRRRQTRRGKMMLRETNCAAVTSRQMSLTSSTGDFTAREVTVGLYTALCSTFFFVHVWRVQSYSSKHLARSSSWLFFFSRCSTPLFSGLH